ncbi:hypothetical protein [Coleofasciculus sp. F4-SAH-05]|uniref:hypothetical protein n=1 Tax=Coleofasciculus sp. F4-SAH-05 TaxID=3069525 RepID=UPI0032F2D729
MVFSGRVCDRGLGICRFPLPIAAYGTSGGAIALGFFRGVGCSLEKNETRTNS